MDLFEKLGISQKPPSHETERSVDDSFRPDAALLQEETPSASDVEFKEYITRPSIIKESAYHDLLTKEPGLSVISSDADEDYFALTEQCINLAESMKLTKIRNQLHAQMIFELTMTKARKGKLLELLLMLQHKISKTVSDIKQGGNQGGY